MACGFSSRTDHRQLLVKRLSASRAAAWTACHGVGSRPVPVRQAVYTIEVSLLDPFEFCSAGVGGRVRGSPSWSANRHYRKNGLALAFRKARRARRTRRSISQLAVPKIEAILDRRVPRGLSLVGLVLLLDHGCVLLSN